MPPTRTTIALEHLRVLVRVSCGETIEYDFQQRALRELEELDLVTNVHETRPALSGAPRLRAVATDRGREATDACVATLAKAAHA